MEYPKVSVVIGSFNRLKLLELCIEAVREELKAESHEIIVVDGGSTDGTIEWLAEQKDIIAVVQHNRGEWRGKTITRKPWAYFMNLGFKCASGKYICMLSDDSLIVPGAIKNGVCQFDEALAREQKLGAIAFYFRDFPVRKKFSVAVNLGNLYVNHGLFLRSAMAEVGYCDEDYFFYFADTDLALKLKVAGYEIVASEDSFVEHYFNATPEIRASNEGQNKLADRQRLISKWEGKAYPAERRPYFEKHVGRWEPHPMGNPVNEDTIRHLISITDEQYRDAPKISVITVIYNDPVGLARTVKSVAGQDYPYIEFIVVDGGSEEPTRKVLNSSNDSIDVLISEKDDGIYDAMNKGAKCVTGDFAIYMNAGDTFHASDSVSKAVTHLQSDADVFYGDRVYRDGEDHSNQEVQKSQTIEMIKCGMPFCHQAVIYRASFLHAFPFNTTFRYAADYDQFVRAYAGGRKFHRFDEIVCDFYAGGGSESGIRPYLECLKIQFDNFGDGEHMKESKYMKGLIRRHDTLFAKYK